MTSLTVPGDEASLGLQLRQASQPLLVLVILLALLPCDRVAAQLLRVPFYGSGPSFNHVVLTAAQVLRALAAGVLVDAFGIKRVLALGLIAWSGLTMATGFVVDPRELALIDLSTALSVGPFVVTAWVLIGSCLPPRGRALPLAIVVVASYLSVLAVPLLQSFVVRHAEIGAPAGARQVAAFLLASIGAFITFVWLVLCPAPFDDRTGRAARRDATNACNGLVRLLGDWRVWPILLLFVLAGFAFEIGYYRIDRFLAGERGIRVVSPYGVGVAGSVIAAIVSDQRLARTGSPAEARRPFVVAAFLLPVGMIVLPILPREDLVAMACIIGLGLGLQVILGALVLDIVPLRHLGAFAGTAVAISDLVRLCLHEIVFAVWPHTHSYASILVIGGLASLAGGALTARSLRDVAPIELASA